MDETRGVALGRVCRDAPVLDSDRRTRVSSLIGDGAQKGLSPVS